MPHLLSTARAALGVVLALLLGSAVDAADLSCVASGPYDIAAVPFSTFEISSAHRAIAGVWGISPCTPTSSKPGPSFETPKVASYLTRWDASTKRVLEVFPSRLARWSPDGYAKNRLVNNFLASSNSTLSIELVCGTQKKFSLKAADHGALTLSSSAVCGTVDKCRAGPFDLSKVPFASFAKSLPFVDETGNACTLDAVFGFNLCSASTSNAPGAAYQLPAMPSYVTMWNPNSKLATSYLNTMDLFWSYQPQFNIASAGFLGTGAQPAADGMSMMLKCGAQPGLELVNASATFTGKGTFFFNFELTTSAVCP